MSYKERNPKEIEGYIYDSELEWLYNEATKMYSIVEVGSWKGRSSQALLLGCDGPVIVVDTFDGNMMQPDVFGIPNSCNVFKELVNNLGHLPNLSIMKMQSHLAAQFFKDKSIDMVFIDGSHEYSDVKLDIVSWLPKCRKVLCGHDYFEGGVAQALKDLRIPVSLGSVSIWVHNIERIGMI